MLNACETQQSFYELLGLYAFAVGSVFAYFRFREQVKEPPQVREIQYALDTAELPYEVNERLLISKSRTGGPPYFTFPPEVKRNHIEKLYDVHVRAGQLPTEKAMLSRDMSRAELRVLRDHLYQHGWAEYLRNGNNAPWQLNAQGKANVIFWAMRLNGKLPFQDGRKHTRRISQ